MNIEKHIKAGLALWKPHWVTLAAAHFVALLISLGTCGLLGGPMVVGLYHMLLKAERGETPAVGDLFYGFQNFGQHFIFGLLLLGIFTVAGLIPFGPVIAAGLFLWAIPLMLERKLPAMDAIKASLDLAKRNYMAAILVPFVGSLLSSLGMLLCCVGYIATQPYSMAVAISMYRELLATPAPDAPPAAPPPTP